MKAKMGSMSKTMIQSGISFDRSPNEQNPQEQSVNRKQRDNFAARRTEPTKLLNVPS
jgi:hypothetical protein